MPGQACEAGAWEVSPASTAELLAWAAALLSDMYRRKASKCQMFRSINVGQQSLKVTFPVMILHLVHDGIYMALGEMIVGLLVGWKWK